MRPRVSVKNQIHEFLVLLGMERCESVLTKQARARRAEDSVCAVGARYKAEQVECFGAAYGAT